MWWGRRGTSVHNPRAGAISTQEQCCANVFLFAISDLRMSTMNLWPTLSNSVPKEWLASQTLSIFVSGILFQTGKLSEVVNTSKHREMARATFKEGLWQQTAAPVEAGEQNLNQCFLHLSFGLNSYLNWSLDAGTSTSCNTNYSLMSRYLWERL